MGRSKNSAGRKSSSSSTNNKKTPNNSVRLPAAPSSRRHRAPIQEHSQAESSAVAAVTRVVLLHPAGLFVAAFSAPLLALLLSLFAEDKATAKAAKCDRLLRFPFALLSDHLTEPLLAIQLVANALNISNSGFNTETAFGLGNSSVGWSHLGGVVQKRRQTGAKGLRFYVADKRAQLAVNGGRPRTGGRVATPLRVAEQWKLAALAQLADLIEGHPSGTVTSVHLDGRALVAYPALNAVEAAATAVAAPAQLMPPAAAIPAPAVAVAAPAAPAASASSSSSSAVPDSDLDSDSSTDSDSHADSASSVLHDGDDDDDDPMGAAAAAVEIAAGMSSSSSPSPSPFPSASASPSSRWSTPALLPSIPTTFAGDQSDEIAASMAEVDRLYDENCSRRVDQRADDPTATDEDVNEWTEY